VKRVRIAAAVTQCEMAEILDVSQPTIAKIEGGRALRPDQAEIIDAWWESRRLQLLADLYAEIQFISKL
jgi:transcriptional regulator with XRE-family HTH domain